MSGKPACDPHPPPSKRSHPARELSWREVSVIDGEERLVALSVGAQNDTPEHVATWYPLVTLLEERQLWPTRRDLYGHVLVFGCCGLERLEVVVPEVDDLLVGHRGDPLASELAESALLEAG